MDPSPPDSSEPWFVEAFGADYLERYAHRSLEAAEREAPFLISALEAVPGARVLDLCCGSGRYLQALCRRGVRVLGLDLSASLLKIAQRDAPGQALCRADMRDLPLRSQSLDGVINLFTSFGYFEAEEENRLALREAARVLRPGGRLVLDFFNLTHTLAALCPCSEQKVAGGRVVEERCYDARRGRLEKVIRIQPQGGAPARVLRESVRAYRPEELETLFGEAGLEFQGRYGDLCGAPFEAASSPRCVTVGRKR